MKQQVIAFDEDEINIIRREIKESYYDLKRIFNEIQDLADDSKVYSDFSEMDKWRKNIACLKKDCNELLSIISGYQSSLKKTSAAYDDFMIDLSKKIETKTVDFKLRNSIKEVKKR